MTGGLRSRSKGQRGQREAVLLLLDRDWQIVETSTGRCVEDMYALDDKGRPHAVEVKHQRQLDLAKFRGQAREQAARRKCAWLLMCRLEGHPGAFLVEGTHVTPTVWRIREETT